MDCLTMPLWVFWKITKDMLWISTNKGVSKFDPNTNTFRNYTESDGLQSDQFNRWSNLKLSTGELLFGGTNGFNMFNPKTMVDNKHKPQVYITDFKVFNKPVPIGENEILTKNILLTKEITLELFAEYIFVRIHCAQLSTVRKEQV